MYARIIAIAKRKTAIPMVTYVSGTPSIIAASLIIAGTSPIMLGIIPIMLSPRYTSAVVLVPVVPLPLCAMVLFAACVLTLVMVDVVIVCTWSVV